MWQVYENVRGVVSFTLPRENDDDVLFIIYARRGSDEFAVQMLPAFTSGCIASFAGGINEVLFFLNRVCGMGVIKRNALLQAYADWHNQK